MASIDIFGYFKNVDLSSQDILKNIPIKFLNSFFLKINLTTNRTSNFISSISTTVSSRASYGAWSTPTITTSKRTIFWVSSSRSTFAYMRRLIATITAAYYSITKFIFRNAFSISALVSLWWTSFFTQNLTVRFVFTIRTVVDAIASSGPWNTFSTWFASKSFCRAFVFRTFFIWAVGTVFVAIADEEPTYAVTIASTLKDLKYN